MSTSLLTGPGADAPVRSYTLQAPNIPETAKVARDLLTGLLTVTGHAPLVEVARLLVSEVVANVHLHTEVGRLTLEATVRGERVRVSVRDDDLSGVPWMRTPPGDGAGGTGEPAEPPGAGAESEHGRGLLLVQACADAWGTEWHGGCPPRGKSVWFELVGAAG
ncbi:ATP-binding protein [Streptomyces zingiberis]|uniref:ATP-binding protein n=1 Tax=Streptomyces zingiberis TaxID=2053010 RepID=A0ABX1BY02_9ACTN|nr:ATP-binding protein [Streptomyces zingiberis]NJQ02535.1 ATP-binding protein [Streptomyces zingiberis]